MIDYKYEFSTWLDQEYRRQRSLKSYRKKFIGARGYPHFDTTINLFDAKQIGLLQQSLSNAKKLANWHFLPFIRKDQRNRRYRHKASGSPIKHRNQKELTHIKSRPIMYASHHDACIFALFGFILAKPYEAELTARNLTSNVIAYRSIKASNNITFAKTAFDFMASRDEFACLLIDIKGFFDNVPHVKITDSIESVIVGKLDSALTHVLKNITQYRYAIEDEVIKEMKRIKKPYFVPVGKKCKRLCKIEDFNEHINNHRFIRKNSSRAGFPQGSPASGLLANIFLLDFDQWTIDQLSTFSYGFYQRYSDDMIIVCPPGEVKELYKKIKQKLKALGLSLSTNKTELFMGLGDVVKNELILIEPNKPSKRENIQYLGLEWDGEQIVLRPSTVGKRFRPKNKLAKKYWLYHQLAIRKISQKGIKKQYESIRRVIKNRKERV